MTTKTTKTTKKPVVKKAPVKIVKKPVKAEKPEKVEEKKTLKGDSARAVGRRKRASARVRITKGTGKVVVNGIDYKKYFSHFAQQEKVVAPLKTLGKEKDLDVSAKVVGGGKIGQADSVSHGLARALVEWNEEFKKTLRLGGYLTRDTRKKERKKFGLKKARRAPQWSKR